MFDLFLKTIIFDYIKNYNMKKLFIVLTALFSFNLTSGQGTMIYGMAAAKTGLISGDIKSLDKVTKVSILLDSKETLIGVKNMNMSDGDYTTEAKYLDRKSADLEEKEKGRGKEFREDWEKAKTTTYPEKFEELFNKYGPKDISMEGKYNGKDADYNLVIKTVLIDPGWNIGIMKKPSFIDIECIFTDKAGKELCRFFCKNIIGSNGTGFDYTISSRVKESYAKASKMLVALIEKERKK